MQDASDGSLIAEDFVLVNRNQKKVCRPYRPLNSKEEWPLMVYHGDDPIDVFDETGGLSDDFMLFLNSTE